MVEATSLAAGMSKPPRPFLIWVTQLLSSVLALFAALGLLRSIFVLPRLLANEVPLWRIALVFAFQTALLALLALLGGAVALLALACGFWLLRHAP